MLYDMLIGTFEEGEYFVGVIMWLCFLFIFFLIMVGLYKLNYEWNFYRQKTFSHKCNLMSSQFTPSTLQTSTAPVFTGSTIGMAVVTTGHSESLDTFWDCENLGRFKTDDNDVFRLAKPTSTLLFKTYKNETRIVGIQ